MGAEVESTVIIGRPVEEVFAYVLDLENHAPKWVPEVESVAKTSEGPIGVGTTFQFHQRAFRRRRETTMRLTAVEPNRKLESESKVGPIAPTGAITFEQANGGTSVTFRGDPNPVGPFKLLSPLIRLHAQRIWDTRLANLKSVLEGSESDKPSGSVG